MTMSSVYENVHLIAQKIDGWLDNEESRLLFNRVSTVDKSGCFVEIGSWCGKSLVYILNALINVNCDNKVFSIDPYLTSKGESNHMYEVLKKNLTELGLWDRVCQIKEKSQIVGESWDVPISLIFIDGFHRYEAVKKDFVLFFEHVIENGFCLIHDVGYWQGPTDLVLELEELNKSAIVTDFINSTICVCKKSNPSEEEIEKSRKLIQVLKNSIANRTLAV